MARMAIAAPSRTHHATHAANRRMLRGPPGIQRPRRTCEKMESSIFDSSFFTPRPSLPPVFLADDATRAAHIKRPCRASGTRASNMHTCVHGGHAGGCDHRHGRMRGHWGDGKARMDLNKARYNHAHFGPPCVQLNVVLPSCLASTPALVR